MLSLPFLLCLSENAASFQILPWQDSGVAHRRERGQVKLKPSQASLSECCSHTWEERTPPCPYLGAKLRLKTLGSAFAHSLLMETDTQPHSHESWSCLNFLPSNPPQLWASSHSGTICSLVVFLASKPPLLQASVFPVSPGSQPAPVSLPTPRSDSRLPRKGRLHTINCWLG